MGIGYWNKDLDNIGILIRKKPIFFKSLKFDFLKPADTLTKKRCSDHKALDKEILLKGSPHISH